MFKEPERKTNRHAHSTRDQNTGPFFKRKMKEVFPAIDSKQGYLGPFVQKKDKRGLNTTDHVQYNCVSTMCTVSIFLRMGADRIAIALRCGHA